MYKMRAGTLCNVVPGGEPAWQMVTVRDEGVSLVFATHTKCYLLQFESVSLTRSICAGNSLINRL